MGVEYSIEYVNSVMEVRVSGTPDRASITEMWKDIITACDANSCHTILGISNIERPMKLADAIDHQAIFLEAGVTIDHRIAWAQLNPAAVEMNRLAETVLLNRGMVNGRIFTDEFEARRWLAGRK